MKLICWYPVGLMVTDITCQDQCHSNHMSNPFSNARWTDDKTVIPLVISNVHWLP